MMRWCHPLILLVSVALDARGISGDSARGAGLLLTSTSEGNLRPAVQPGDLLNFDLSAMTTQIPAMLMLMVVSLIVVIMSLAGPEMVAKLDLDWDRARSVKGVDSARAGGTAAAEICFLALPHERLSAQGMGSPFAKANSAWVLCKRSVIVPSGAIGDHTAIDLQYRCQAAHGACREHFVCCVDLCEGDVLLSLTQGPPHGQRPIPPPG